MNSAFGSKRKARKIQVDEEDDGPLTAEKASEPLTSADGLPTVSPELPTSLNFGRKAFKKSSLRQSITFDDTSQDGADAETNGPQVAAKKATIARSSSTKKKKAPSSRLSFGPGEIISGDAAEALEESLTPKKGLGRRLIEMDALKKQSAQRIPFRDENEDRPSYSKDYLNELKSSTPTTPKDLKSLSTTSGDQDGLDALEVDGATIVELEKDSLARTPETAYIPSEAEIREKKERRSRLAHEQDFISLNDAEGSGRAFDQHLSLLPYKKKAEKRLVREDEDLGEGYDEFVDDGRISLGKKQEREARRKQRNEIAAMIRQAEGSSDEDSNDSEAEVRGAFEAAQTRAGMDGLLKVDKKDDTTAAQIPSKITALPILSECLERLQATLSTMEQELSRRRKKMADLKQEKMEIAVREAEIQKLLNQAGQRNSAQSNESVENPQNAFEAPNCDAVGEVLDRGLESFGNTPAASSEVVDLG